MLQTRTFLARLQFASKLCEMTKSFEEILISEIQVLIELLEMAELPFMVTEIEIKDFEEKRIKLEIGKTTLPTK